MDQQSIIADLKAKKYESIYFLEGEEGFYIDVITQYIHDYVLNDMEKEFNLTVLYGKDCDVPTIINTAKRFPMMAPYQVVIVKEAQNLDKIEELIHYVENPQPQTILVINYKYKKLDKRKALAKKLKEKSVHFESKKLYDNQIAGWIQSYVQTKNRSISPKASVMLYEFLGTDLSKIANELEKLSVLLPEGSNEITPQLIERNIGISKDFNAFELQKALVARNVFKANLIITHFAKNEKANALPGVLAVLYGFFANLMVAHYQTDKSKFALAKVLKVNPYFADDYVKALNVFSAGQVYRIIGYLRQADANSKGVGTVTASYSDIMKELVFKILH